MLVPTIIVKQEFNTGGNILDAQHYYVSAESVEAHICADDWIKTQYRQQEFAQRQLEHELSDYVPDGETIDGTICTY